jgi:hypothetical protein
VKKLRQMLGMFRRFRAALRLDAWVTLSQETGVKHSLKTAWVKGYVLSRPALFVFGLALLLRIAYYWEIADTVVWQWERWEQSDMDTILKVSRQILDGDLLVPEPYRPLHSWHRMIGSAEEWQTWSHPHVFYQVPGYYFLLALLLKLSSGSLTAVKVFQMLLGATHAALLTVVGRRIMGPLGGLLVGLFVTAYGPLIALEPSLLHPSVAHKAGVLPGCTTLRPFQGQMKMAESKVTNGTRILPGCWRIGER